MYRFSTTIPFPARLQLDSIYRSFPRERKRVRDLSDPPFCPPLGDHERMSWLIPTDKPQTAIRNGKSALAEFTVHDSVDDGY